MEDLSGERVIKLSVRIPEKNNMLTYDRKKYPRGFYPDNMREYDLNDLMINPQK